MVCCAGGVLCWWLFVRFVSLLGYGILSNSLSNLIQSNPIRSFYLVWFDSGLDLGGWEPVFLQAPFVFGAPFLFLFFMVDFDRCVCSTTIWGSCTE